MNVTELFQLAQWITTEIENKQIPQKYQNLINIIDENIRQNRQPNIPKKPFALERETLLNALEEVPLNQLTDEQLNFLDKLKIKSNLGVAGAEKIEDIFYKNVVDEQTILNRTRDALNQLNAGIQQSNQLEGILANCVTPEKYELEDKVIMRVNFSGNVGIYNVKDLKDWSEKWYNISYGITTANECSAESVEIIGTTKGSIIIEFAVAGSILTSFKLVISNVLKLIKEVYELKILIEKFKNWKIKNSHMELAYEKLSKDYEDTYAKAKDDGIEKIVNDESTRLDLSPEAGQGDKIIALRKSIGTILDFVEKGGEVDFFNPAGKAGSGDEQQKKLSREFAEIRELENQIKQIGHDSKDES